MSFETGDVAELRSKPEVDLSDAGISSTSATAAVERVDVHEPEEHETQGAADTISADLPTRPDSLIGESDDSTLGAVPERLEIKTTEESETEFETDFTKDLLHFLGVNGGESPSETVTELQHFENGESKQPKMDEPAAEVASEIPDSLTDCNDPVTLSYRDAVLEHLEDGGGEEPNKVAEIASNVPDTLTDRNDAVTVSYRDAVLEHLEDGESKVEETAVKVASNVPDISTGSNDPVTLSYRDAVLEHLEDGEGEEPKAKDRPAEVVRTDLHVPHSVTDSNGGVYLSDSEPATDVDAVRRREEETKEEDPVVDTGFGNSVEVCSVPLDSIIHHGADKVQVTPKSDIEKNESEPTFENRDESEATSILGGASDYLASSKQLPLEVGKNVIQLQCESSAPDAANGLCLVNILGTAHVSKASCEEVQALIQHVKPEVVFLELCSSRTNVLLPSKREVPTLSSMIESYKKKQMNLFGLMYCWFLAKVGEKLEVVPGTEFRVAYEEAVRCGALVTLGDRPIQITLKRTWGKMNMWHKTKFLFSMLTATFSLPSADEFHELMEKMKQSDELTLMIQELSKTYPTLLETLVVERDLYMVASLRTVSRRYSSVVAVVGRGHLSGIADHWKEDINVDELLVVPPKNPLSRVWLWGTVALGVGGIAVGVNIWRRR